MIIVTAPSRLHFGLFGLAQEAGRMYGGVGVMIEPPILKLQIRSADEFCRDGPLAERIAVFATRWARFHGFAQIPHCSLELLESAPNHVGLGVGTQLGLAVAAGLNAWAGLPAASPQELALSVGRGDRSAV